MKFPALCFVPVLVWALTLRVLEQAEHRHRRLAIGLARFLLPMFSICGLVVGYFALRGALRAMGEVLLRALGQGFSMFGPASWLLLAALVAGFMVARLQREAALAAGLWAAGVLAVVVQLKQKSGLSPVEADQRDRVTQKGTFYSKTGCSG
jgi:hypothetical protein